MSLSATFFRLDGYTFSTDPLAFNFGIFFLAHPCEYPRIPLNGNRTCYEDDEGVVCQFFCLDGYTFAIEPAKQYTCAFDNKWEPADKLPISDCTGTCIHNLTECQPHHIH